MQIERFEPPEIVALALDRDDRVLPQPIGPAFLDHLAGLKGNRQADAEELRWIGIVTGRHRQRVDRLERTLRVLLPCLELLPPALDLLAG